MQTIKAHEIPLTIPESLGWPIEMPLYCDVIFLAAINLADGDAGIKLWVEHQQSTVEKIQIRYFRAFVDSEEIADEYGLIGSVIINGSAWHLHEWLEA